MRSYFRRRINRLAGSRRARFLTRAVMSTPQGRMAFGVVHSGYRFYRRYLR